MKTFKSLAAAFMILFSVSAFAADESANSKSKMESAVGTYIDAMNNGKLKELASLLDPGAKYTISRGDAVLNYSKGEFLETLKPHENVVQNCKTDYKLIEFSPAQSIVKVTMKYDSFSKVNFVTFSNTAKGWKITNISTSFN
ncbi:nuclear transport factor 2 family protein [Arcticibacter sp. MXS-1]|uniref:nuclear transport factor 2 family protein n=1 Tax=Arcticibacter sp. MXS-1 TaxID=3341726 RepID=UPI0035A8CCE1